jgi:hypothetical protein
MHSAMALERQTTFWRRKTMKQAELTTKREGEFSYTPRDPSQKE